MKNSGTKRKSVSAAPKAKKKAVSTSKRKASAPADSADNAQFAVVKSAFEGERGIEDARMFGSSGLKTQGKVFAMVVKDALVVKLPAPRVKALLDSGVGKPFDPGHGKVMKEWVSVDDTHGKLWLSLAREARSFVDSR